MVRKRQTQPFALDAEDGPTRSAVLSDCGTYRYRLARVWQPSEPRVLWIMLNPSTADGRVDDPTIRRCMGFSRRWGFGSMVVQNVYAYRATKPRDLEEARRRGIDVRGRDADQWLWRDGRDAGTVVAAWGARVRPEDAVRIASILWDCGHFLHCLGTTNAGHPRHPLYVRADQPLERFTIGAR